MLAYPIPDITMPLPFEIGDPCLIEIDTEKEHIRVKPISENEAKTLGWRKRNRRVE